MSIAARLEPLETWFQTQGWQPFAYQREAWLAYLDGHSGMIQADTGSGKTYAALLGALAERLHEGPSTAGREGLQVLWITPLRALAADTTSAIQTACDELGLGWEVLLRTGDSTNRVKQRLQRQLPEVLVTTPESLSLLLSYAGRQPHFQSLRLLVVDEWHELLGSKRGTQTELALARLRRWCPRLRTWGISATLGNAQQAGDVLMGAQRNLIPIRTIAEPAMRQIEIQSLIPESIERFPWAGHLGLRLLEAVADKLEQAATSLVFTNTRSQAEHWYQQLLQVRPQWAGTIAVHHGSLDPQVRDWVEESLRAGKLRAVVCTSSLDLGVDFPTVEQVLQIGSPKGIARMVQRAGRSGHRPGLPSRLWFVPTHAFELVEIAAARAAMEGRRIESREPWEKPLDVLAQHVVTLACGDGFDPDALFEEVRTSWAFRELTQGEWDWVLDFVQRGGPTLEAYPDYRRVVLDAGLGKIASVQQGRRHRMTMGTISSDQSLRVKYLKGGTLGMVEESFLSRLKPGDPFVIGGKVVELVRIREMTAYVRRSKRQRWNVPKWVGGKMPLSTELGGEVRRYLERGMLGSESTSEWNALEPLMELQQAWSHVPQQDELLVEQFRSSDGHYTVLFPFEGRAVHEGLASLWAYRLSQRAGSTYGLVVNDYAVALVSPEPIPVTELIPETLAGTEALPQDVIESLNLSQMTRQRFRDIARIAGLVFAGYPGQGKSARQLQASSNLFFDVFQQYDPENLLLEQARREVLARQLQWRRLEAVLEELQTRRWCHVRLQRPTPFSFPLVVERLRDRLSTESLAARIRKMQATLEREAARRLKQTS